MLDDLTIGEAKQLAAMFAGNNMPASHPYRVGENYFIQTVTHYYTGKLEVVHTGELVLSSAAWIADTGRLTQALTSGTFDEVEIVGTLVISRGAIVTAALFSHSLPQVQK